MKKNHTAQAAFFNLRPLIGSVVFLAGVLLEVFTCEEAR